MLQLQHNHSGHPRWSIRVGFFSLHLHILSSSFFILPSRPVRIAKRPNTIVSLNQLNLQLQWPLQRDVDVYILTGAHIMRFPNFHVSLNYMKNVVTCISFGVLAELMMARHSGHLNWLGLAWLFRLIRLLVIEREVFPLPSLKFMYIVRMIMYWINHYL